VSHAGLFEWKNCRNGEENGMLGSWIDGHLHEWNTVKFIEFTHGYFYLTQYYAYITDV
jgi:hypothetical protein